MNRELRKKPGFAQSLHNFTKVDPILDSFRKTGDAFPDDLWQPNLRRHLKAATHNGGSYHSP